MGESGAHTARGRLAALREKASSLPTGPGVYSWLDRDGTVIYVGKAKNLRLRVLSYFRQDGDGRAQIPQLMAQAADLDYLVTGTEIEALITEANMVRSAKPRYNVRLKDDKRYPFIKLTNEPFPRIYVTRKIFRDGARYLGPYTDVRALRRTLEAVQTMFPLRKCRDMPRDGQLTRACLNYQIGRCAGPCMGYVSGEEYAAYVEDAYRFLSGRNTELLKDLQARMKAASDALEFEKAASLRDLAAAIEKVNERRRAFSTRHMRGDWDVVNVAVIDSDACVVVMDVREGALLGKKDYRLGGIQYAELPELLTTFLMQYYLDAPSIPAEVHLPEPPEDADVLEALLTELRGAKCTLVYPRRGEKHRMLAMAALNAETILRELLEKRERRREQAPRAIHALERDLRLTRPPRTIACIDISHLHGTDTVGSLVFFRDGVPEKKEYRRFTITTVDGIDDFASMREVVSRYFTRRIAEKKALPDLLLVDGGKGQLSSACEALRQAGATGQPVAGLAKRLEEVFLPGSSEPQNIPKTSSAIHLLQRIRDEAHRFAITAQRKRRTKRTISTALTELSGIGEKTAAALLRTFGSVRALRVADVADIAEVPGIGRKKAEDIYGHLHQKDMGG